MTGTPYRSIKCGEVKEPVLICFRRSIAEVYAQMEPFPFVPPTCMDFHGNGTFFSSWPIRSSPGWMEPTGARRVAMGALVNVLRMALDGQAADV